MTFSGFSRGAQLLAVDVIQRVTDADRDPESALGREYFLLVEELTQ